MSSTVSRSTAPAIMRHSVWDGALVALALVQGGLVVSVPSLPLIAVGIWWNSNTISHQFIHNPFFTSRMGNRLFALYLTVLLGFPHAIWRSRHLAHHANQTVRLGRSPDLGLQSLAAAGTWITIALTQPAFFAWVYLPGFVLGMVLCSIQGHYEHSRGTVSCYGRVYNWLMFKDGLHVEHHRAPCTHWTRLSPARCVRHSSLWPPLLRWIDWFSLTTLEHFALRSRWIQRWLIATHQSAFRKLLAGLPEPRRIGIVGGALFPRTAIVLRELLPQAELTVIDLNSRHLEIASGRLPADVTVTNAVFKPSRHSDFDLLVFPLSYRGNRRELYRHPAAPMVIIHDWIWRRHHPAALVSCCLLKRLNLVLR